MKINFLINLYMVQSVINLSKGLLDDQGESIQPKIQWHFIFYAP